MRYKGSSSTETILTMVLLIMFSLVTLSLVVSASGAYKESENEINNQSDIRIAQSYLYTKLRQNMEAEKITLEEFDIIEGSALTITERINGEDIKTVIFVHEGFLREGVYFDIDEFNPISSFEITKLKELNMSIIDENGLAFETINEDGEILKGFVAFIPD